MFLRRYFLEILIALRYLRGQSRTAIFNLGTRLSFFFMALMVFTMVIVLCVFTGFQKAVHNTLWNSGYHITVSRQARSAPLRDYGKIVESLQANEVLARQTRSIFPAIQLNGLLEADNAFEGKGVRALPVEAEDLASGKLKDFPRLVHYRKEYLEAFDGGDYVLVGREMARAYGWDVGDRVRLILPRGGVLTRGIQVKQQDFRIAGFFRTGFYEFDLNLIFMSLGTAQRLLGMPGQATDVIVQLNDLSNLERAEDLVEDSLPSPRYRYGVSTLRRERGNFLEALRLEKTMMIIILSLLIMAGAAGIWVTVHMLVKTKTRSIGMLRAMGLPTSSIVMIFTAHAMWIGFLAAATGGSIGIFIADRFEPTIQLIEDVMNSFCRATQICSANFQLIPRHIYYFDHLPVQADLAVAFSVALAAMILSGLAGYFPALIAARLKPVETIRND